MYGSLLGNAAGTLYFLVFQFAGFLLFQTFFKKEHLFSRIILGSVAGSLLLQWLPVLTAFLLGFTPLAHIAALLPLVLIFFLAIKYWPEDPELQPLIASWCCTLRRHICILVLTVLAAVLWIWLLYTHTLRPGSDGALHCGQSTYGDMCMHLGFITSIAVGQGFPPDYSIFPGVKLAYPFLSDSISSSIYVFGASLRYAYILPMVAAFLQITGVIYLFAYELFRSRAKAVLAWVLYLFNGGFGFAYFLDWSQEPQYHFSDIFNGYYTTPTNLVGHNIRWVNIIADMLIPQRATLFGYAAAFPCIYLLYRAIFSTEEKTSEKRSYFLAAGLLLGGLPLIHTHSFLAVGLISASWLLYVLVCKCFPANKLIPAPFVIAFFAFMYSISFAFQKGSLQPDSLMYLAIAAFAMLTLLGIVLLVIQGIRKQLPALLTTWGLFLLVALAAALPQLLGWTFGQVSEGGFVRGHFNWGNLGDDYLWFYIKNLGLPFFLILGGAFSKREHTAKLLLPAGIIWLLAELVVFTPNTYDNNKLLYIAYLLLIFVASDYAAECFFRLKELGSARILAIFVLAACTFSGVLTLIREVKSDYQLFNPSSVKLAEFVEEHTEEDAVFLTNTRHVNEVAALTGRSIVCGADIYLFFHGIDTTERKADLRQMYEAPGSSQELFRKYAVDYVVVTDYETTEYAWDEAWFESNCELLFREQNARLYRLQTSAE